MSRNIQARKRMSLAIRRRRYRELVFNKCGPYLRWRQWYTDEWDIIWSSSVVENTQYNMWHPVLLLPATLSHYAEADVARVMLLQDPRLEYSDGGFESTILGPAYSDPQPRWREQSLITQFDGFDVPDDGPYAIDYRHGPNSDAQVETDQSVLLWRVRRPWWVV